MNIKIIKTDGYGSEALVEIANQQLIVMDSFSCFPESCIHGNPEFSYLTIDGYSWEEMFNGNPNNEKRLICKRGWSYDGLGEIISINPTIVDFGLFSLDIDELTNDERCIGEFIKVCIDRLDLMFYDK